MPVAIRSASPEDVPALLAIEQHAYSAAHWSLQQYEKRVAEGAVLVAEVEGTICGFVCARVIGNEWEIENVVVTAASRRRGVASGLLTELLGRVQREKGIAIWLEVRASNQAARSLYEKAGFQEVGQRLGYYRDPSEDAVLYEFRR